MSFSAQIPEGSRHRSSSGHEHQQSVRWPVGPVVNTPEWAGTSAHQEARMAKAEKVSFTAKGSPRARRYRQPPSAVQRQMCGRKLRDLSIGQRCSSPYGIFVAGNTPTCTDSASIDNTLRSFC